MKKLFLLTLGLVMFKVSAQDLYLITFVDKGPHAAEKLKAPETFLSQNAILRKKSLQIPIQENDLPINTNYISKAANILATYQNITQVGHWKWFNTLYVHANQEDWISDLLQLEFIEKIEKYPLKMQVHFAVDTPVQYGASLMQSQQIGGNYLHNMGFLGQGMFIAVFDGGFHNTHNITHFQHMYSSGRFKGSYSFVNGDTNVYFPGSHGTNVLGVLASASPNLLIGSAPLADYWLIGTENEASETKQEEINWLMGAEMADSLGVDIINSSLGYNTFDNPADNYQLSQLDGQTAIVTQAALMAARKGILVVNSAGNEGNSSWQKLLFPADADSILAVAAVNFEGNRAAFSSMGPTADNRIKPDVAARGVTVATSSTAGLIGPQNGTSFSAPLVSGFAACLWQSNPNFSAQQIRDAIIKSAHQYQNPDSLLGYGIVNFQTAFDQFVGIQRFENNSSFSIYPNPAKEYIQLKLHDEDRVYKNSYKIYNTTGQVVLAGKLGGDPSKTISLYKLPQGMYYLSLNTQKGEITQRFIKH